MVPVGSFGLGGGFRGGIHYHGWQWCLFCRLFETLADDPPSLMQLPSATVLVTDILGWERERELHDFGDSSLAIIPITFDDFERWFLIIFRGWNFFGEWEGGKCLYYCACPSPVSALVLKPWIGPGKRWIKSEDSHRVFGFRCSSGFFVSFSSSWWGRLGSGFARVEIFLYRSASLVRSLAQSLVLCQLEFLLALMLILDH